MREKKEFVFLKGRGWWFKDPSRYWLHIIPLSDRLELAVIDILRRKAVVTLDDVLQEIYTKFTNAMTPTRGDIRSMLEEYAEKDKRRRGLWKLKSVVKAHISEHTRLIERLAVIGTQGGFKIWIGKREQSAPVKKGRYLRDFVHEDFMKGLYLPSIDEQRLTQIQNIDILWIDEHLRIRYAFEVEYTTAITEALRRLKSILYDCARVIVIPKVRNRALIRKVDSLRITGMLSDDDLKRFKKAFFEDIRRCTSVEDVDAVLQSIVDGSKSQVNLTIDFFMREET
ncbi:MAG: hypothetical protein DRJ51_07265 [Thermoprotei archaeon]|nr:MAG: hypothetical protein DRJ51_07265 [Thermoprotei archaeon]